MLLEVPEGGRSAKKGKGGRTEKLEVGGSCWELANSTTLPRSDVVMAQKQKQANLRYNQVQGKIDLEPKTYLKQFY